MMDPIPNQSITAWPWADELDAVENRDNLAYHAIRIEIKGR